MVNTIFRRNHLDGLSIYRTSIQVFSSQSSMLVHPVLKKNCERITQLLHSTKNVACSKHPLEQGIM